jgi:DNA mismatch endonuclease (patch repair protein)
MSAEKRSALMSRIRGANTVPERTLGQLLMENGLEFESHAADLPGKPDFVFRSHRTAVFLDGDFWHGWRFPLWRHKLSDRWQRKIAATRERDRRNFRMLRRNGWIVIRIWEHQLEQNPKHCVSRILLKLHPN